MAAKKVRHLASLASGAPVVPYKPEPGLLPVGEPDPKFVIVDQQQIHLLIKELESEIAAITGYVRDYAEAHGETLDYW
jgi:hypothetical protein